MINPGYSSLAASLDIAMRVRSPQIKIMPAMSKAMTNSGPMHWHRIMVEMSKKELYDTRFDWSETN